MTVGAQRRVLPKAAAEIGCEVGKLVFWGCQAFAEGENGKPDDPYSRQVAQRYRREEKF